MDELARELPEYEEINKMPGVGKKLTSRIIAEIGDVRKFKNAGSIIAYARLDAHHYINQENLKPRIDIFLKEETGI